ncbi:YdcF family protein [Longispora sp. NPDC051575]|uniref:YdcF family protein n=1 Tax=Longispora sp. NPDC051575 TaxID=3154943 RepID=UPI003435185A
MISDQDFKDGATLLDYHQLGHDLEPCSVAIVLGGHDLTVPEHAADLYHRGLVPRVVISGGPNPTTPDAFPNGEAAKFRDIAVRNGVPSTAILLEPAATNTGANITLSRQVLADAGTALESIGSVLIVCMPSMQRRAYATCRKVWPEVRVLCSSATMTWPNYLDSIGDHQLVLSNLVGDTQRVIDYPALGYAIEQDVPADVLDAHLRLIAAGYTSRLP